MKNIAIIIFLCFLFFASNAQPPVVNGWTEYTPSADSRIIYVSDVSGVDASATFYLPGAPQIGSDPFNPVGSIMPYKTITAAKAMLRPGFPDWILFKKGETWTNQRFGVSTISGRNLNEITLIGSYGTSNERPRILTGTQSFIDFTGSSASFLAINGLYIEPHSRDGLDEPVGVRLINAPFDHFSIENCIITRFFQNIALHDPNQETNATRSNLTVRRSVLSDAYTTGSAHANAMFIANVSNILFEENLLDHNGWSTDVPGANPTGFRHNSYFQTSCVGLVFRKNIVSRAGATGGGFRCGGIITDNLFIDNPKNIQFGTHETTINWPTAHRTGEVSYNVVLGCRPESFEQGTGIQIQRIRNAEVHHNIVAHFTQNSSYNNGILLNEAGNVNLHDNIIYNWGNNQSSGPAYSGALTIGGGIVAGNLVTDNHIQMKNPKGYCVINNGSFANVSFNTNKYHNINSSGNWFDPGGSFAGWRTVSGETSAISEEVPYTDAGRNISTYLNSIGAPGSLNDFLLSRRNLQKNTWNNNYMATNVNNYIRAGFDISIPMAVNYNSIAIRPVKEGNELIWSTNAETDNAGFEIEWSSDGNSYVNIGFIAPKFQTGKISNYSFIHKPEEAINYYRIRQIDLDGSFSFSKVLYIKNKISTISISPNPASSQLFINNIETISKFTITDLNDGIVLRSANGFNQNSVDISNLIPGIYFIKIQMIDGNWVFKKFVKS